MAVRGGQVKTEGSEPGNIGDHGYINPNRLYTKRRIVVDDVLCVVTKLSRDGMVKEVDLVPNGTHRDACLKLADILEEKGKAYGDSGSTAGPFLRLLFPGGIPPEALDDVVAMSRIFEKFKRIANNPGKADPGGEDPWVDVAGHAVVRVVAKEAK